MGLTIGSSGQRIIGSPGERVNAASTAFAVELHIEELVLHGFPAGHRFGIGDALQQELTRLVAERGLPGVIAHPVNIDRIDAGTMQVGVGARPRMIGTRLAEKLHQQFTPTQRKSRRQPRGKQR